jgi:hypothetical protein
VRLKSSSLENKEAEELLDQMDHLPLHDCAYTSLHAHCILRYPHLAKSLANPEMSATTTSFSYQAAPPPPPIVNPTYTYQATSPSQPHIASTYGYQAPLPPPPPRQPWAPVPTPMPHQSPPSVSKPPGFFHACSDRCAFCTQKGHHLHECPVAEEYIDSGRVVIINHWIHLPNGQLVPNDGTSQGIKASIDNWLIMQYPSQVAAPTTQIKEVVEAHILQVMEFSSPLPNNESEDEAMDIFEVFTTQKRK